MNCDSVKWSIYLNLLGLVLAENRFEQADIKDFPYTAYVTNGRTQCAGSIISSQWVMTSGRCAKSKYREKTPIHVIVGSNIPSAGKTYDVAQVIFPENEDEMYREYEYENVGLMKIKGRFKYGKSVARVKLNQRTEKLKYDNCVSTGWGPAWRKTDDTTLRSIRMEIIGGRNCNALRGLFRDQLCIKPVLKGAVICVDGTGAPLVCNGTQIGVGIHCQHHSVYFSVSFYYPWIIDTIKYNTPMPKKPKGGKKTDRKKQSGDRYKQHNKG